MAVEELVSRLETASARLAALQPVVERGAPWPLSDNIGTEPEASWGPPETLAHVAEMLPFWLGEIERLVEGAGGGNPVPFGRVATDQIRLLVLERDRSLPPRELFARIAADADRTARRLAELTPAQAAARGIHPRRGEMSVEELAERFIVDHLEEHAEQLSATLRA